MSMLLAVSHACTDLAFISPHQYNNNYNYVGKKSHKNFYVSVFLQKKLATSKVSKNKYLRAMARFAREAACSMQRTRMRYMQLAS